MIRGRTWKFGDAVNTDVILPGKYLALWDPKQVAPYIMEGIDPDFTKKARPGDIIIGGRNFGCGSSRENAPAGLKGFGIGAVIAASFSRIFLRNSINIGLPVLECPEAARAIPEGHEVSVDVAAGRITDETTRQSYVAAPFPPLLVRLIAEGGLVNHVRNRMRTDKAGA